MASLGSLWTQARVPLIWRQSGANYGLGETRCSHPRRGAAGHVVERVAAVAAVLQGPFGTN